jgi:hypothetical protein
MHLKYITENHSVNCPGSSNGTFWEPISIAMNITKSATLSLPFTLNYVFYTEIWNYDVTVSVFTNKLRKLCNLKPRNFYCLLFIIVMTPKRKNVPVHSASTCNVNYKTIVGEENTGKLFLYSYQLHFDYVSQYNFIRTDGKNVFIGGHE